jgi:hypothetical protein
LIFFHVAAVYDRRILVGEAGPRAEREITRKIGKDFALRAKAVLRTANMRRS